MASVTLPVVVLPVWALALAYAVAGVVSSAQWLGYRSNVAAALFRACMAAALYWAVDALLLGAVTAQAATSWIRLLLPAAFFALTGLADAAIALNGLRLTSVRIVAWSVGLAAFLFFLLDPASALWFSVHRVPDGFFLANVRHSPGLTAGRFVVFAGGVAALVALIVRGKREAPGRPWRLYLLVVAISVPLVLNDAVWAQSHHTPFPMTWCVGVIALAVVWRELWAEGHGAYEELNRDRTTDAASRAYGEIAGQRSLRLGAVGVVYVDLDNFKSVNDRFGHSAGDRLLREIVSRLVRSSRPGDTVVRMGGDELLVILPGCGQEDGSAVVERLRAAVTGTPIAVEGLAGALPTPVVPSVSMGFAWGGQGGDFGHLVQRADEAMYEEKREHRQGSAAPALDTTDPLITG